MAKTVEHPLIAVDPKLLAADFPGRDSDINKLLPAAVPHVTGLALWAATAEGAPRNAMALAGELRRCLRACWQPAAGMGLGAEDVEKYVGYYRPDANVRKLFASVDQALSSLAAVGLAVLGQFAELGIAAATAEERLLAEIKQREEAVQSIRRVLSAYTAARASAPAVSARR